MTEIQPESFLAEGEMYIQAKDLQTILSQSTGEELNAEEIKMVRTLVF